MTTRTRYTWAIVMLALGAAGCNTSSAEETKPADPPTPPATVTAEAAEPKPPSATASANKPGEDQEVTELVIKSVGNKMEFDLKTLTVREGARVRLVFKNEATMEVMAHNWVLVKPGTEAAVAAAGLEAGPTKSYAVPGPDVLALSPLAPVGTTVEVTFTAPAAGEYPYICTVPGHYVVMKGVLTVTK